MVHKIYRPNHHANITFHLAVRNGVSAHHWRFEDMPRIKELDPEKTGLIIRYVRALQIEAGIF